MWTRSSFPRGDPAGFRRERSRAAGDASGFDWTAVRALVCLRVFAIDPPVSVGHGHLAAVALVRRQDHCFRASSIR
jgi:hypothetical protein